jgi:hypothetical protein
MVLGWRGNGDPVKRWSIPSNALPSKQPSPGGNMKKVKDYDEIRARGSYVWLYPEMMDSPAFQILTASAIHLLLRVLRKRKHIGLKGKYKYEDYKNDGIRLTYSEAKNFLGMTAATFTRSRDQLIKVGFIRMDFPGGFKPDRQDPAMYTYLEEWKKYGTTAFVPGERAKAVRQSYGFDEHNKLVRLGKKKRKNRGKSRSQLQAGSAS